MTLLLDASALDRRRSAVAPGGPLAPLAASLLRELERVITHGVQIPEWKALLSRDGGRCPRHGAALEFDPFTPHEHRCPVDGEVLHGERHDRWWVMGYQLWLAERAVHAAALGALLRDARLQAFATRVIGDLAEQYLRYPDRDNVLGPSRPFFSTYLESIWLLQLCVALDLLELSGAGAADGRVRDRLIAPSAALIASYDEGGSNRQVWNDAALLAAAALLADRPMEERAIHGAWGVIAQLEHGLLSDGTWYEGENYHLFAHRGLWYGVTMLERRGVAVPPVLRERFDAAFTTPLVTALPDFTFPARRDSQYGVSLHQWRFAESCELGLARRDTPALRDALATLYESPLPRRDTGRWRSTAEAERNEPPTVLARDDLGWRSLLLAREMLPPLTRTAPRSALLDGQGIAVLRRDAGRAYVALDYGHAGGGHGHPDRLDVLLAYGDDRWLDDMGTGSYVDPALHWYRSTLAHDAPLVDGTSQRPVHGVLRAFDERGGVGWVDADVPRGGIAEGVSVRRSLAVMPDYAIDRIAWDADRAVRFELPVHAGGVVRGGTPFRPAALDGGIAPDDGFAFVHDAAVSTVRGETIVLARAGRDAAWMLLPPGAEVWRAIAPGPPGSGERLFHLLRVAGASGCITIVWSWAAPVARVRRTPHGAIVELWGGERHEHEAGDRTWRVAIFANGARSSVDLGGAVHHTAPREPEPAAPASLPVIVPRAPHAAVTYHLGEAAYRRSEVSWQDAGAPEATVRVRAEGDDLVVEVDVRKSPVVFRAADAPDPALDNEHPDIHSDGVQLYVDAPHASVGWLAVPDAAGGVRVHVVAGSRGAVPLAASWRRTASGYAMRFAVPLAPLGAVPVRLGLQVVVNDMGEGRERRRGQLVLTGGAGEFVYLRGDRETQGFLSLEIP